MGMEATGVRTGDNRMKQCKLFKYQMVVPDEKTNKFVHLYYLLGAASDWWEWSEKNLSSRGINANDLECKLQEKA
ncbi:hypothetical protein Tco_1211250 [Tanacetum coccineum]